MDEDEIIQDFIHMEYFEEVKETKKVIYTYTSENTEGWWNFAYLKKNISNLELNNIQKYYDEKQRKSSVYIIKDNKLDVTKKLLMKSGYSVVSNDSWMFWNKGKIQFEKIKVIEARNDKEIHLWLETFIKSYPKDDPKNPYGEQKDFAKYLEKRWKEGKTRKDKYFISFDGNKPAAVAILTKLNDKGYISAVGSIPEVRGRGFGKNVTLHCINESINLGNRYHFLATEKGHFPYDFYTRLGFKEEFMAQLYSKN
jgi:ribosomal protein S18 acetylase RimI-like enzyme